MTRSQALSVLGLDERSTPKTLKKAYRRLALIFHPDKGGDIEKFKDLANAYGLLTGRGQVVRQPAKQQRWSWVSVVYQNNSYTCGVDYGAATSNSNTTWARTA